MGLGLIHIGQYLAVREASTEYGFESTLGLVQYEFHIIRPAYEQQVFIVFVVLPLYCHRGAIHLFPLSLRIRGADFHCYQVVFLARRINLEGITETEHCAIRARANPNRVVDPFDNRVRYRPAQGITSAREFSLGDQPVIAPSLVELDAKVLT